MSEKIKLSCPHCGVTGMAPSTLIGRKIKCHRCGNTFVASSETSGTEDPASSAMDSSTVPAPHESSRQAQTLHEKEAPSESPHAPPQGPQEPLQQDTPERDEPVRVRANRVLAGRICPSCKNEVMLGEHVIQCDRCSSVSHASCWDTQNGCSSSRCLSESSSSGATSTSTRVCSSCAEQIPEDARVCPYCAEPIDGAGSGVLPITFITGKGDLFTTNWNFTATEQSLVGKAPGKEDICISRAEADSHITLKSKKMRVLINGKKKSFTLDDIGHMAMRSFLGQPTISRSSVVAQDALIYAIVGMFCCQIILGPVAYSRATRAKEMMNLYPESISGRGMATAAQIIAIVDILLFALYVLMNMLKTAGS